tara:strand:- start:414 stop:674 length:261 start_codon:yes stop_codon:yes gene_type:complete
MTTIPYLPTEIVDLIYTFKHAMELRDHHIYYSELLEEMHEKISDFLVDIVYEDFPEFYFECLASEWNIGFNNLDYDPLAITSEDEW